MKVYLVDGTYELFRAFFGAPSSKSPAGLEVGATRGLLRSMLALLDETREPYLAVAFDRVIESFRNELYEGYKTGEGIDPELRAQFGLAEEGCAALGLATWPMIEFEADDALATAAASLERDERVEQVLIASPDKDLAQCVRDARVVCLDRKRGVVLDERGVWARFGVAPESIPDYLALVGDAADGIPGIARWGAKSAAAVLAHYHHIETIPDDANAWPMKVRGARTLADNLRSSRPAAELYRRLARLRLDAPLDATLERLHWRGPRPELEAFAARLGDQRIVRRAQEVADKHGLSPHCANAG